MMRISSIVALCLGSVAIAEGDVADGRAIYRTGASSDGRQIMAAMANGCHGTRGQGKSEGGIRPPDITWSRLTKPYGDRLDNHRVRKEAYSPASLIRAITEGIDSSGNKLDVAMPRYQLAEKDANALVDYLKVLENEAAPGVTAERIRIAMIGASDGSKREALEFVGSVNQAGGIYRRRLQLVFTDAPDADSLIAIEDSPGRSSIDSLKRLTAALRKTGAKFDREKVLKWFDR